MEKTITFTVTDALLSPVGLSILSGAGLFKGTSTGTVFHKNAFAMVTKESTNLVIDLEDVIEAGQTLTSDAPIFVTIVESDSLSGNLITGLSVSGNKLQKTYSDGTDADLIGSMVHVDFYVEVSTAISELVIEPNTFGGTFYVEGTTLVRRQTDGIDMPMGFTMPNVKVQSNMTFSMAATGDPSTFDFTMDALPGYTYFDKTKKVQCVMQIIEDTGSASEIRETKSVMKKQSADATKNDSIADA